MSECIYCGNSGKLTREHILPSFVYQYHYQVEGQNNVLGWREKPGKIIYGEAKIKDVCEHCNNITLSEYDSHAKEILENARVFTKNFLLNETTFDYDYRLLSRWLLKVAYNSSRASGKQTEVFEKFKKHIIDKDVKNNNFFIGCGLLKPVKLNQAEFIKYGNAFGINKPGYINPFFTRISWVPSKINDYTVKQIVIGALVFHICVFTNNINHQEKKKIKKQHIEAFKNMQIISSNKSRCIAAQMPITFIDSMGPHMLRDNVKPEMDKLLTSLRAAGAISEA